MLQILWEQGWIDERQLNDYTINGKKDALGTTINEMSLKYLLGNGEDFINKESMLQYYGRMMGSPLIALQNVTASWLVKG
jgi:hypothetical protein